MKLHVSASHPVYVLSLLLATVLSLGTSWMLFNMNKELTASQELFEYNLPTYSVKTEYELARLVSALNKFNLGTSSREEIQLHFDIFLGRLNHYQATSTSEKVRANFNISSEIDKLRDTMYFYEDRFFALQQDDVENIASIEKAFRLMYKPLEELSTQTRESYDLKMKDVDNRLARGIHISLILITATIFVGALTLALFWYSLYTKTRHSENLEIQIQKRTQDLQISNAHLKQEIAERKRTEKTLKEREQQIHRIQKMETIGKVTSGVAHDFNNLLAVIMGNIELLKSSKDPSLSRKYLDSALSAAHMGSQLTRKLLAFGRRSPLKPEDVNVNQLILDIDNLLMHSLPDNIHLNLDLSEEIWRISVDRALLENVILNLIINARDALQEGGCIYIETNNVPDHNLQTEHEGVASTATDYVSVSITDAGTGMTAQVLDQAFEPFFSTKTETQGSGLGLSMASGFTQQSNGFIEVTSAPGKGTCVQLLFPRKLSLGNTVQTLNTVTILRADKTRKILVVEDSEAVRKVVAEQLEMLGYTTVEVSSGAEAMKCIKTDYSIDLMLSDVVMPGALQGLELAERASKLRPELKILIMSGFPKTSNNSASTSNSRFTKLMKPVSFTNLSVALSEAFNSDMIETNITDNTQPDQA